MMFIFSVVVDCQAESLPLGSMALPPTLDTSNLGGIEFNFQCEEGYSVKGCSEAGNQQFSCKENGRWSIGSLYCQGMQLL